MTTTTEPTFEALLPPAMAVKAEQVGVNKANLEAINTFLLAVLAGAFISLGAVFATTVTAGAAGVLPYEATKLLGLKIFLKGLKMENPLMQIGNALITAFLRSPFHWILSKTSLLVAVTGRKSGHKFTLPVNYFQYGEILYSTGLRRRKWWRNLRGGAPVTVRLEGRDVTGIGAVIENSTNVLQNLKQVFKIRPKATRFFGTPLDATNHPNSKDIFVLLKNESWSEFA